MLNPDIFRRQMAIAEMEVKMNIEEKIQLLEMRLQNLMANEKENQGVCRKIRRDIRNLRKAQKNISVDA